MLYNTGTIAINGNTATGTGTNWTAPASQVRAGQTIIALSNPVQIFQISSVDSATSLTVTPAASPALSGQKYGILVSDNISVDGLAQAMSQLIKEYDENIGAWETFATTSANQSITVTINGIAVTIPAIGKLAQKGTNGALPVEQGGTGGTNASDARTNLGLGDSATRDVGTASGTVAAGDDSRLGTVNGKTGGTISSPIFSTGAMHVITQSSSYGEFAFKFPGTLQSMSYAFCENFGDLVFVTTQAANPGTEKYFAMRGDRFITPGNITCVSLTQTSDSEKKDDIKPIECALDKVMALDGVTFNWKDSGLPSAGVIAQELIKVLPEAVGSVFEDHDQYESVEEINADGEMTITRRLVRKRDDSKRSYTVEYSGVIAICLQAIKELNAKVEALSLSNNV